MRYLLLVLAVIPLLVPSGAILAQSDPTWELIEFDSATLPPTPLALRRAEEEGVLRQPPSAPRIRGFLALPSGDGPFPVVVLLPDCNGLDPFDLTPPYPFRDWGYAVLWIDSLEARGLESNCIAPRTTSPTAAALDAHGALAWLADHLLLDASRAAVMGWGFGGQGALVAVDAAGVAVPLQTRFRAAVAVSPFCAFGGDFMVPPLLLVGAEEELGAVRTCRFMLTLRPREAPLIELVLLDGAREGFDRPRYRRPQSLDVGWRQAELRYHEAAHEAAAARLVDYLDRRLGADGR